MRTPILSFDGHDLVVFTSAAEAVGWTEPPDVDVGPTYDADGQVLRFEAVDDFRVSLHETGEHDPEALRTEILGTFRSAGIAVVGEPSLEVLVSAANEHFSLANATPRWMRALGRLFSRS